AFVRKRPGAEQPVLGVQPRVTGGQVVGDLRRQADAEIHDRTGLDLARGAARHLFGGPGHGRFLRVLYSNAFSCSGTCTISCTKMPGRCTSSGSIAPLSRSSSHSTIVRRAADAITGLK